MVGVALAEGVGVVLVGEVDGVGVGAEPQPLKSKTIATAEVVKTAEIRNFLMLQIYPVLVQVKNERAM